MSPVTSDQKAFQKILSRNVALPLLMSFALCGIFIALVLSLLTASQQVNHSNRVIGTGYEMLKQIIDAETGLRGFIITKKEKFLDPYHAAVTKLPATSLELSQLVDDDKEQGAQVEIAMNAFRNWDEFAKKTIQGTRKGHPPNMEEVEMRKTHMDAIRVSFAEFLRSEEKLRDERTERTTTITRLTLLLIVLFTALVGGTLAWLGRKQLLSLSDTYEETLQKQAIQNEALADQAWIRTGEAELGQQMRGDFSVARLSERILDYVTRYSGSNAGGIYVSGKADVLNREASFALEKLAPQEFSLKEGTVGQVAFSKSPAFIDSIPAGYFRWVSGLGEAQPRSLAVIPFTADGELQAVIELAFLVPPSERTRNFLLQIADPIGMAIRSAKYRTRMQDLLHESQQLTEELQTQQEELKVSNEELEERSRALLETQARLESQHAELEQTNEQLEEQAQLLENQRETLNQQNQHLELARATVEEKANELETSSRYKSEFLANMSHELRTPLNSSLILAKLLMDNPRGNLSAEQVEFASTIYSAGNDLLNLINDILDLSKVEAGKLEILPEKVRPRQLAELLERTVRPLATDKGLRFRIEVSSECPDSIVTDRQRVEQILRNLLSNAVKFTTRGEVALRISADKAGIAFAVSDTGIGIRSEQADVIFEAFRQADGTTNRKYGGTGLGLSISRNLAQILGGAITVRSEVGTGSTFTLTLPLEFTPALTTGHESPPVTERHATAKASVKTEEVVLRPHSVSTIEDDRGLATPANGKTLLIVEDDATFARQLLDVGRELGYHCLVSGTTAEGFELALQFMPAAILLDMRLPDALGLSLLDRLKGESKTRHIPVQAISVSDYSREALNLGAIGYAKKPPNRAALKTLIQDLRKRIETRTKHVLVIEDDKVQRKAIEKLIGEKGVAITSVGTAEEGLERLTRTPFDCAIIDLSLPDMTGFELLEKMSENHETAFPPVIVYTAHSLSRAEEERLSRYSRSIILKGARSPERLLDEVSLFLHQSEAQMTPEQQKLLSVSRNRDRAFDGRLILLADDDVRNIFALTSALEYKGAKVVIARNGREAIEKLHSDVPIDLVLMDIMMPEMDGYEAIQEIRKEKRFENLPIIAVTAKAMRDDYEMCLEAGANDYLAKPIDTDKLVALMRVWLPKPFSRS